jgi:hypothetical protein
MIVRHRQSLQYVSPIAIDATALGPLPPIENTASLSTSLRHPFYQHIWKLNFWYVARYFSLRVMTANLPDLPEQKPVTYLFLSTESFELAFIIPPLPM